MKYIARQRIDPIVYYRRKSNEQTFDNNNNNREGFPFQLFRPKRKTAWIIKYRIGVQTNTLHVTELVSLWIFRPFSLRSLLAAITISISLFAICIDSMIRSTRTHIYAFLRCTKAINEILAFRINTDDGPLYLCVFSSFRRSPTWIYQWMYDMNPSTEFFGNFPDLYIFVMVGRMICRINTIETHLLPPQQEHIIIIELSSDGSFVYHISYRTWSTSNARKEK